MKEDWEEDLFGGEGRRWRAGSEYPRRRCPLPVIIGAVDGGTDRPFVPKEDPPPAANWLAHREKCAVRCADRADGDAENGNDGCESGKSNSSWGPRNISVLSAVNSAGERCKNPPVVRTCFGGSMHTRRRGFGGHPLDVCQFPASSASPLAASCSAPCPAELGGMAGSCHIHVLRFPCLSSVVFLSIFLNLLSV